MTTKTTKVATPKDSTPVQIGNKWYTLADNYRKGFESQKACANYVAKRAKGDN